MGAFYANSIGKFIDDDDKSIIGSLTTEIAVAGFYQQLNSATLSYREEISILKSAFMQLVVLHPESAEFGILLEYPIARREKRIDVVIITNNLIIVIEFKVGSIDYLDADKEQLMDYCLDLRDFHFESRGKPIIPILLATDGEFIENEFIDNPDWVQNTLYANTTTLVNVLTSTINKWDSDFIGLNSIQWNNSDYSPTPTIIEAAKALYAGKDVVEISNSHAKKKNLTRTSNCVIRAIKKAKEDNKKIICFITGVPGAGKTLAGLNIVHDKEFQTTDGSVATFLSGNVPLIKVLKEALAQDAFVRAKKVNPKTKKNQIDRNIAFIENVHRFIDHYFLEKARIPNNKIVVFDEAQRAWDAKQSKAKFKRDFSEPELMLEIMSRHKDWSVIVALVGGGQEINTGEAGLRQWGEIIKQKFGDWKVYISPQLKLGNHSTGNLTLFGSPPDNVEIIEDDDLHLEVSIRSYKAEQLSNWVNLVLTNNPIGAHKVFKNELSKYAIMLTRDLDKAKHWLRSKCFGTRRMGLVASSGGRRLRPYGLEVKLDVEVAHWFLGPRKDTRSSYYLEIPTTEYTIQGLELDWVGVCWDADLRRGNKGWDYKRFKGTVWEKVKQDEDQKYWINKYRVLLTRAREGMVIFVPPGDPNDITRAPSLYNPIADYLKSCGVPEI